MGSKVMMKCFFILFLLVIGLSGCSNTEVVDELINDLGMDKFSLTETLTMEGVQDSAEENSWSLVVQGECFEMEGAGTFAYDRLSEVEKLWYEDINTMLAYHYDKGVRLSEKGFEQGLTEEDIDRIYNCVMMDHPEYFYVEGYEYTRYTMMGKVVGIDICGQYILGPEECLERKEEIEEAVENILLQAPLQGDDYEKIKFVYEYIIFNTDYDLDAPDNQNIYSVFVGESSVCQGYAKATQYLLNCLGVECSVVYGQVHSGEAHSWNIVKAGQDYYHVDTTWGDASYSINGEVVDESDAPDINYDYLCITTEQIAKTHEMKQTVEIPECNSNKDNYYIREGNYFYGYDEEQLKREFTEAFTEGKRGITLKCDSLQIYEEIYGELIHNQKIFVYLDDSYESVAYIEDEEQLTLTFWVTK